MFRVVAETQHLPTAASLYGVGASSLSRAVRRLEAELGVELFERRGRRLVLSRAGLRLLADTRDAMRLAERATAELRPHTTEGVRVYAEPAMRPLVGAALARAEIVPEVVDDETFVTNEAVDNNLRSSALHIVFRRNPGRDPNLTSHFLGLLLRSAHVAPGHPLHGNRVESATDIQPYEFSSAWQDGWPTGVPRRIGTPRRSFDELLGDCLSGNYIAMLPDFITQQYPMLQRLDVAVGEPLQVHVVLPTIAPFGVAQRLAATVATLIRETATTFQPEPAP